MQLKILTINLIKRKTLSTAMQNVLKNNSVTQGNSPLLVLYNIFLKNKSNNVVNKKKNAKGCDPKRKK